MINYKLPIIPDCLVYIPMAGIVCKTVRKLPDGATVKTIKSGDVNLWGSPQNPWWLINRVLDLCYTLKNWERPPFVFQSPVCPENMMFRIDGDLDENQLTQEDVNHFDLTVE